MVLVAAVCATLLGAAVPDATTAGAAAGVRTSATIVNPLVLRLAPERLPLRPVRSEPAARKSFLATPCGQTPGLLCSDVVVPLDRAGATPGSVTLKVETLPAPEPKRGVMFLIAGGPGQGSAGSFALGTPVAAAFYQFLFPGYTLVAFDNRGTGNSGFLDCPALDGYYDQSQEPARVAACAEAIGPNRVYYGTDEHVEDLDAVRLSLGAERVGLWGTSYGTKLATAYALAHPGNVERLLLDSVLPPDENDPFRTKSSTAIPPALASLCEGGACSRATRDFVGDVGKLANQLAAKPISGKVRNRTLTIRGVELLSLIVDSDLSPGIAVALPAAVKAALGGNPAPLLRLFFLDTAGSEGRALSVGLFAATVCTDGPFPWTPDAAPATRRATIDAAAGQLPSGAFGPFGRWAAKLGNAEFCLGWPAPSGLPWIGVGPLPNVPVLALNGGYDMRTPPPGAQVVVSRFPQGRLIVVPGVGHSVLGADPTFCAARETRAWILGQTSAGQCAKPRAYLQPSPAFPAANAKKPLTPAATFAAANAAFGDAVGMWLFTFGAPGEVIPGIYSGRLVVNQEGFRLDRYSVTPGVVLTGRVTLKDVGPPLVFEGTVTVSGKNAAPGLLGFADGKLAGVLGGRLVG